MHRVSKPLFGLLALALTLTAAHTAFAFTHFPNAACPDTMTINDIKTRLDIAGPCNPVSQFPTTSAPGDTIYGTQGIIIGFDKIPTGFDAFIQMAGGGPNTGIDVFFHGNPPPADYALGDLIDVEFAGVGNFQGDVELEAPNNNFSNPDIIVRKISSGNPLPPFFVGNTTDLKELPTNATFAPYVSALVHLNGPVTVARSGGALGARAMLVVSAAAPNDSVFIDYGKMTNFIPPAVGTVIQSIQGIGNKATRGFRIMPRDGNDIIDNVPPGVTDAYPVADNKYRVVFDRNVTAASATNTGNYTLASFGSVDAAAMDGTDAAILTVSGTGLNHGDPEQVQINGITGSANGQTMTTAVNRNFLAGVLTCGEMSRPNPDTLHAVPCVDKGLYTGVGGEFSSNGFFGTRASFSGIVTGQFGNLYYMEDGTTDPAVNQATSRGITAFAPPAPLQVGHRYLVAGAAQDFWQENEFTTIQYVKDLGTPGVPAALTSLTPDVLGLGDPCDVNQNQLTARDYLSTLVTLTNLKVVPKLGQRFSAQNNIFYVAGPSTANNDTIFIENLNNVLGANSASNANYPPLYSHINVTGVVHFINNPATPNNSTNAATFRICPRSASDIVRTVGVGDQGPKTLSFSVYPNPARTVNLAYTLAKTTNVDLAVYDLLGRKVAQLAKGTYPAGVYQQAWNATNSKGEKVGPGVYFYRLRAGDEVRSARTLLLGN